MQEKQRLLAQTLAMLMSTTPDTKLGKLMNFCLAAKVDPKIAGKTPFEIAKELIESPDIVSSWVSRVINSDGDYTGDKILALSAMHLEDPQEFMDALWAELDALDVRGMR